MNVSVVITAYKRYNFLPYAIESVLKQTEKPKEIIVVADEPEKVPYKDKVYVVESKNEKYGSMILEGVKACSGDLISFLEDDDLFHPEKIERVKKFFENKEIVAVHNSPEFIDLEGKVVGENNPLVQSVKNKKQPRFQVILDKKTLFDYWKNICFFALIIIFHLLPLEERFLKNTRECLIRLNSL